MDITSAGGLITLHWMKWFSSPKGNATKNIHIPLLIGEPTSRIHTVKIEPQFDKTPSGTRAGCIPFSSCHVSFIIIKKKKKKSIL